MTPNGILISSPHNRINIESVAERALLIILQYEEDNPFKAGIHSKDLFLIPMNKTLELFSDLAFAFFKQRTNFRHL